MEFARRQLEKYGWTDGKGLGKKEDGISEAIKPKLKRSVTGVGYDHAKDFTEHWWSELYNKAASNVQVEEENGKTKKIKCKDDDFEITSSTWHLKSKKNKKNADSEEEYKDYFIKTEVFDNDGAKTLKVRESESSDENDEGMQMSDDQLFAACGGRTAHKGARHGLRALGKLARIEKQEQQLLKESRFNGYSHSKKNKKITSDMQIFEDTLLNDDVNTVKPKNKKKKKKCIRPDERTNINIVDLDVPMVEAISTKKLKRKKNDKNDILNDENNTDNTIKHKKKKINKSKENMDMEEIRDMSLDEGYQNEMHDSKVNLVKKAKKKKHKNVGMSKENITLRL